MIEYTTGDIFNSKTQSIVIPVNTVGIAGKGLALTFKNKYFKEFIFYHDVCQANLFDIGDLIYLNNIILFPTKKHWSNPSEIEYIETGLKKFVGTYNNYNIDSIAFPKLGCGLGKLNWTEVKLLMEKYLKDLPIRIVIYE
jgi:O-acetyl-ADP-ribose deacetylase (regulator of RNase III)